jgi:hypothetical protein
VTELLYVNNSNTSTTNNIRRQTSNQRRQNTFRNTNANTSNSLGRLNIGDRSFIIDSYEEYYLPSSTTGFTSRNNNSNNRNANSNTNFSRLLNNFFEPVIIYPTQSQIEAATRRVRYCDIVTPLNNSCPISLEPFNDSDNVTVIRHCGHIFNTTEINNWFRSNCVCPVCRYDIRNYSNNNNNNNNNNIETRNQNNNLHENINPNTRENINPNTQENINYRTSNLDSQYLIDLIYDLSGNFLSDNSDASAVLNIFSNLLQRRNNI